VLLSEHVMCLSNAQWQVVVDCGGESVAVRGKEAACSLTLLYRETGVLKAYVMVTSFIGIHTLLCNGSVPEESLSETRMHAFRPSVLNCHELLPSWPTN